MENQDIIKQLAPTTQQDIAFDYHVALFEIGKYNAYLDTIDPLIESVIIDDIRAEDCDLYYELLARKAASLYNIWDLPACQHISDQLIRMYPEKQLAKALVFQCIYKSKSVWSTRLKAISIATLLLGFFATLLTYLIIDPYYHQWFDSMSVVVRFLFASSVIALIFNEVYRRLCAYRGVQLAARKI